MVLTKSGHSLVAWSMRIQLPRFNALILRINNYVLAVREHPTAAYLLSASFDCLLEQGLYEPSFVLPIGADPVPVGGHQSHVGFLGPKGFLS